jgi:galactokinase
VPIDPRSLRDAFSTHFSGQPKIFRAPGRVNIIGGHTDYNEGFVLPTTTGLYTWVAIAPRDDRQLHVYSCRFDGMQIVDLDKIEPREHEKWCEYVKGVAWALQEAGYSLRGADIAIDGDIPLGGGLSSSASLEAAIGYSLLENANLEIDRGELAQLCQRAETDFVGVRCGIMDQYVISRCVKNRAMMLDCRSLEFESIALPSDARIFVVDTGVHHELPVGDYNSRREECEKAVAVLATEIPGIAALRDVDIEQLTAHKDLLDDRHYRRARHIVSENRRVRRARVALENGDVAELGNLISASHASLRDDFQVSCAESDALVEIMNACPGVLGARMVGAGFGGCTIGLADAAALDSVIERVRKEYGAMLGSPPWTHCVTPSDPVGSIPAQEASELPWKEVNE